MTLARPQEREKIKRRRLHLRRVIVYIILAVLSFGLAVWSIIELMFITARIATLSALFSAIMAILCFWDFKYGEL